MKNNLFITIEGIDGSGKSTHIDSIRKSLVDRGYTVVVTREPGGTPLAEAIRASLLNDEMDVQTQTLLAFAARRDHINNVIRPALEQGCVVLCDRFTDSTFAYQGFGGGMSTQAIESLERLVQMPQVMDGSPGSLEMLEPGLTLWFDLDPVLAAQRLKNARLPDRFESQPQAYFSKVQEGYQHRMAQNPSRIKRIEANQPIADVFSDVRQVLDAQCDRWDRVTAMESARNGSGRVEQPVLDVKDVAQLQYRYGLVNRCFGIGAWPTNGFLRLDKAPSGAQAFAHGDFSRYGVAVFDRPLTDSETRQFELSLLPNEAEVEEIACRIVSNIKVHAKGYVEIARTDPEYFEQSILETVISISKGYPPSLGDRAAFAQKICAMLEAEIDLQEVVDSGRFERQSA
jgi:dTMP kinase